MTRKLPKQIKIGPVDYTIHLFPKDPNAQLGACVYAHQRIYLSKSQLHQQASDTLLHEVMHAIWRESGLDFVVDLTEESTIRTMSTWLRMVIRDNPAFLQFITDASEMWPYGPTSNPDKDASSGKREDHA